MWPVFFIPHKFQSTPPVKAATVQKAATIYTNTFQSTPPVKAATFYSSSTFDIYRISIHAAREGGDGDFCFVIPYFERISIHAAREGGDGTQERREQP